MEIIQTVFLILYFGVLVLLSFYGAHRYLMAFLYAKHRNDVPKPRGTLKKLPPVTIQLPIFNEKYVVERLIDAVCKIRYPNELFEIQVLDDSTDETVDIARSHVEKWQKKGIDISHVHRTNRHGYKAGALEEGMKVAKGEFIAVFDADFVPQPDFLEKTVHYFIDGEIGMVQVRWDHINRNYSLLTQAQSILLDGHFIIEHTARNRSDRFFNFNGTAGIWRKVCIEEAGGWQHDTLTEDLDLSYRAQEKGWKFIFLIDVLSPAEIPVEMNAFKTQQHRWAKGSIQTAKKILPRLLRSKLPFRVKQEAFCHLTNNVAHVLMVLLCLLMPLSTFIRIQKGWTLALLLDVPMFVLATYSVCSFYVLAQKEVGRTWGQRLIFLPFVLSLGIGLCLNSAKAVIEAMVNYKTGFTRTPKYAINSKQSKWKKSKYTSGRKILPYIELAFGLYFTLGIIYAISQGAFFNLPFLFLFQFGFLYVGMLSLFQTSFRFSRRAKASLS